MAYHRLRIASAALSLALITFSTPAGTVAQDVSDPPVKDTSAVKAHPNTTAGEFTPARGFDIFKTELASLNISFYGLFRYVNELPDSQTYRDHLGRLRDVKERNDMNWHRTMVWLTGFFYTPRFRYNITMWSLPTSQQTLLFGNLAYEVSPLLTLRVGILPNLTARSLQGSWPFWAGSDRQMATEFFRGGFSSGFAISGMLLPRFYYTGSINTNISQLGVTATNDARNMATSASVLWMPTTGEFGPRGGFGDLEHHTKVATRFGASFGHAREPRAADVDAPPNTNQIRLSDGVVPFETGALAEGVTVLKLNYNELAVDAGLKYRGLTLQWEGYWRKLSKFDADGPLPQDEDEIVDRGFMGELSYMIVPRRVGAHAVGGYVWDDFERHPWELGGGLNYYPNGMRAWRLNLHVLHVNKTPTSSIFGYYTAGQTGTVLSLGIDILM